MLSIRRTPSRIRTRSVPGASVPAAPVVIVRPVDPLACPACGRLASPAARGYLTGVPIIRWLFLRLAGTPGNSGHPLPAGSNVRSIRTCVRWGSRECRLKSPGLLKDNFYFSPAYYNQAGRFESQIIVYRAANSESRIRRNSVENSQMPADTPGLNSSTYFILHYLINGKLNSFDLKLLKVPASCHCGGCP